MILDDNILYYIKRIYPQLAYFMPIQFQVGVNIKLCLPLVRYLYRLNKIDIV